MSGGGGGFGSGPVETDSPCEDLEFETTLGSPDPTVVAQLQVGDELFVDVHDLGDGLTGVGAFADLPNRPLAGTIVDRIGDLLRCMQDDHTFVAEVLRIRGGSVRVKVRAP